MAEEEKQTQWQKYKESKYQANVRYWSKFRQLKFYCEPELYDAISEYCALHGESVTGFMKRIAREAIEAGNES